MTDDRRQTWDVGRVTWDVGRVTGRSPDDPLVGVGLGSYVRSMATPPTEDLSDDVLESVPWEALGRPEPPDRRTWYVLGAAAVVVVAISASAARTLWPSPPLRAPVAGPSVTQVVPPTTSTTDSAPTTTTPAPLISEADLRAVDPEHLERWAASHAEWFLAEWFTLDGSDRTGVADLLPEGASAGPVDPGARSFVESVSTRSVTPTGVDRFEVVALVRLLSASDGGAYMRQPATAYSVAVGIVDGLPAILDLPMPVELEFARAAVAHGVEAEPPPEVMEGALEAVAGFGTPDRSSVTATTTGGSWRVTLMIEDAAGVSWPVAVWLDAEGGRRRALSPDQP